MIADKPEVNPTSRYSLREVCMILDISKSTIKRWIRAGKVRAGYRTANNRPYVTGQEITRVWQHSY